MHFDLKYCLFKWGEGAFCNTSIWRILIFFLFYWNDGEINFAPLLTSLCFKGKQNVKIKYKSGLLFLK